MPSTYYVSRILPDYRKPILDSLDERLGGRLTICAGRAFGGDALSSLVTDDHHEDIDLANIWISGGRLMIKRFAPLKKVLRPGDVVLIEEAPHMINLATFLVYCKWRNVRTILWGHFSSNNRVFKATNPRDLYRIVLARRADACVVYTDRIKDELRRYVPENRVFVANNTLHSESLLAKRFKLAERGRNEIRKHLGVPDDAMMLAYVGRLVPEKGISRLADTVAILARSRHCVLAVIGDGPERNMLMEASANQNFELLFRGASTDIEILAPTVFASDVMVQPGCAGLSINLGLLLGVPVATIPSPGHERYHGPEIDFVEPGVNGEIAHDQSPEALAQSISQIVDSRERYARGAANYADQHLTTDRMLDGIEDAIRFVTS